MAGCEWAREGCCIGWVCLCDETGRPHGLTGPFEVSPPLSRRVTVVETLDAGRWTAIRLVPPTAPAGYRYQIRWQCWPVESLANGKVMVSQVRQYFVNYSS